MTSPGNVPWPVHACVCICIPLTYAKIKKDISEDSSYLSTL